MRNKGDQGDGKYSILGPDRGDRCLFILMLPSTFTQCISVSV
jgi:hypothetical protein